MRAEKRCFKCLQTKPLEQFYRHSRMAGGRLNKCAECTKSDVRRHYAANRGRIAEYDRDRNKRPERHADRMRHQQTRRRRHPEKNRARQVVARAIRAGTLQRKPCEVCGSAMSQAHHEDYARPLDVRWLCFKHHRETHGQQVNQNRGHE